MESLIVRHAEIQLLKELLASDEPEFLAVYGRRRVGKTFLIREFFKDKGMLLEFTGIKDGTMHDQLKNFTDNLSRYLFEGIPLATQSDWASTLEILTKKLEALSKNKKIILFLDELPWLATKRSLLLQQLDYFWNTRWSKLSNIILVVCGSAASWMLEKLIHAKGGLHNRITQLIHLQPFTLTETKTYLESRKIKKNHQQILEIYMAMGGIPYYLKHIKNSLSAAQNIDILCFRQNGLLFEEFNKVFRSLFEKAEPHLKIVRKLATIKQGVSQEELEQHLRIKSGGTLTKRLFELESAGFVQKSVPYHHEHRNCRYKLIDEYSLFYLTWIEPIRAQIQLQTSESYWSLLRQTQAWSVWAGYAFEAICYKHIGIIKKALKIDHILSDVGAWQQKAPLGQRHATGAQIDLIFDRADGVISICEIKCSEQPFAINKECAKNLAEKLSVFSTQMKIRKDLSLVLITTCGMKPSIWSEELINQVVVLDDFFST